MKKVLVTGAHGFIGRAMAEGLRAAGFAVTGLVRRPWREPEAELSLLLHDLQFPLSCDERFDLVVHAAASLPYARPGAEGYIRDNVDATRNLRDFMLRTAVPRVIYLSSIGVYGDMAGRTISENSERIQPDMYGMTKYMGEVLLGEAEGISCLSLRMPGVVGKGAKGVWLAELAGALARNEPVSIFSPDFVSPNFVHVDDLAAFVVHLAGMEDSPQGAIVLACHTGARIGDIVTRIRQRLGSSSPIRQAQGRPFCLDASLAKACGYSSKNPLEIVDAYCKDLAEK
ncbi:NAD(P)-dependent oxidoreductase [Desulfovibrio sp. OttesenSCG-928-A18]|nr:NAD(P)-dependent oxidoreductase [Desulfovibrio sp. OttesenSCG-928-A18]